MHPTSQATLSCADDTALIWISGPPSARVRQARARNRQSNDYAQSRVWRGTTGDNPTGSQIRKATTGDNPTGSQMRKANEKVAYEEEQREEPDWITDEKGK